MGIGLKERMFISLSVLVVQFTGAWMIRVLWALELSKLFKWSLEYGIRACMGLEKESIFDRSTLTVGSRRRNASRLMRNASIWYCTSRRHLIGRISLI